MRYASGISEDGHLSPVSRVVYVTPCPSLGADGYARPMIPIKNETAVQCTHGFLMIS